MQYSAMGFTKHGMYLPCLSATFFQGICTGTQKMNVNNSTVITFIMAGYMLSSPPLSKHEPVKGHVCSLLVSTLSTGLAFVRTLHPILSQHSWGAKTFLLASISSVGLQL
jgi:hypothetical protein